MNYHRLEAVVNALQTELRRAQHDIITLRGEVDLLLGRKRYENSAPLLFESPSNSSFSSESFPIVRTSSPPPSKVKIPRRFSLPLKDLQRNVRHSPERAPPSVTTTIQGPPPLPPPPKPSFLDASLHSVNIQTPTQTPILTAAPAPAGPAADTATPLLRLLLQDPSAAGSRSPPNSPPTPGLAAPSPSLPSCDLAAPAPAEPPAEPPAEQLPPSAPSSDETTLTPTSKPSTRSTAHPAPAAQRPPGISSNPRLRRNLLPLEIPSPPPMTPVRVLRDSPNPSDTSSTDTIGLPTHHSSECGTEATPSLDVSFLDQRRPVRAG
ncbi:hypothetical protein PAPYR_5747 [Paratrimastix pyriformis]|uniref:Uncharacterized protein n=1 Tax=Paratrimastix pyriformis TaxID=342808 RepID=A0ABQ8UH23_9EUKA|nr:hypothetical protein PAPYR_5747 [Paratrimastix pyriformis]